MNLDNVVKVIRPAAILTTAYVAGTVIDARQRNQLIVYVDFTKGSLDSATLLIEFSPDNTNWIPETIDLFTGGVSAPVNVTRTLSADGKFRFSMSCCDMFIRVSIKGTGTVTSSSATIWAGIGVI